MLLIQGFLKDPQISNENANFKAYYLTLNYQESKTCIENTSEQLVLSNGELENKLVSLNIIKNIKDISGYKDELSSEKAKPEPVRETLSSMVNLEPKSILSRIEVADSGEFTLQLPLTENIITDLKLKAYSPEGSLLQEFTYSYDYLKSYAETKKVLELPINSRAVVYARRAFTELSAADYVCEGELLSLSGVEIPVGVNVTFWASAKELKHFNNKELEPIYITKTLAQGHFNIKIASKNKYKTLYISLSADRLLAKRVELDNNGLIPSKIKLIFRNPVFTSLLAEKENSYPLEEFIFYKALRTTQFGLEDQLNSSSFIKPISCFESVPNLEMKKVAHGHILSIKQTWYSSRIDTPDTVFVKRLVKACYDEKFSDYFIGGDGLTTNVDLRPPNNFEKALNNVVKYAFQSLEEKMKRESSEARLAKNYADYLPFKIQQSLYDARECLFIPYALDQFDSNSVLAFKDVLFEYLLEKDYEPLLKGFKFYNDENCDFDTDNLIKHLNENLEYYHRVIWYRMPANKRFSLLDNCIAPNAHGKSIASIVENRVIGILGNSVIMPLVAGYSLDPNFRQYAGALMELYKNVEKSSEFELRVPKQLS